MGLHHSVVRRVIGMLKRVSVKEPIMFAGGVALNPCVVHLLEKALGKKVLIPDDPQIVGALGAAVLARERYSLQKKPA